MMQPFDAAADDKADDLAGDPAGDPAGDRAGEWTDDTRGEDVSSESARRRHLWRRRARERRVRERRSRWRLVLLGGAAVLVAYYSLVFFGMRRADSSAVPLEGLGAAESADRVVFAVDAVHVDPSGGAFDMRLQPVPEGSYTGARAGQLRTPLAVQLSAPGQPPMSFDFPANQIVDPVAATVDTSTGTRGFPFDRPQMAFRLQATAEGEPVPVAIDMADETEGWNLSGRVTGGDDSLRVSLDADRELLAISFSLFYIAGTVVVALITIAVIGGAIARGHVGFDQVIWLGAMLVAIPAVRNEMPGVPPIGTLVDLFVFLPSVVIVAMALLAAIVVLVINEAAANRVAADGE